MFSEPLRIQSLHCRPLSSTAISCSWTPPESDFDSYSIECCGRDSPALVFSQRTARNTTLYHITNLEPHRHYSVSIRVISDTMTSAAAEYSVVTMIDREALYLLQDPTLPAYYRHIQNLECCALLWQKGELWPQHTGG